MGGVYQSSRSKGSKNNSSIESANEFLWNSGFSWIYSLFVQSLRRMSHPNIVKLREVIRENDTLFFVFEYMVCLPLNPRIVKLKKVIRLVYCCSWNFTFFLQQECNLYQLMKNRGKPFTEAEVRNWCFQVFHALAHMHQRGYFHRDLKPGKLLNSLPPFLLSLCIDSFC